MIKDIDIFGTYTFFIIAWFDLIDLIPIFEGARKQLCKSRPQRIYTGYNSGP